MNAELQEYLSTDIALQKFLETFPKELIEEASLVRYPKRTNIISKGDIVNYLYIIVDGEALLKHELRNGKEYSYVALSPYEFLGDLSILSGYMSFVGTVNAGTDLTLIRIPTKSVLKTLETDFAFYKLLTKGVTRKFYDDSFIRGRDVYLISLDKLKVFLVDYYEDHKTTLAGSNTVTVQKTNEEIGVELGLSRKSISRSIQKLKASGQLTVTNGKIVLSEQQYTSLQEDVSTLLG